MRGAIIGDMIGSRFERSNRKDKSFTLWTDKSTFTDDTVMTVAVAEWILQKGDLAATMRRWGRSYPLVGYGGSFTRWLTGLQKGPYQSWGNGSAMRVSPVGWAAVSLDHCMTLAAETAAVTHDHPEGLRGAQAVAGAVFLARTGAGKADIRDWINTEIKYDLDRRLDDIRPGYTFDVSCRGSVPEAIIAFLEARDLEDAIRNAVSLGGDADTQASIAGAIAEAYWGRDTTIDPAMLEEMHRRLPAEMWEVIREFYQHFD